jgi:hypothetical protein
MARRCKTAIRCSECTLEFYPFRLAQTTCSRSCGAARRARRNPMALTLAMRKAHEVRRTRYKERLIANLAGKTPLEMYRMGYVRGYTACQNRVSRGVRVV